MANPNQSARRVVNTATGEEVIESEPVGGGGLATIINAEVDKQIATAKSYPRDLKACLAEVETAALLNDEVAASCCYTLKKGGQAIKGPSVRLAEIFAAAWGNLRLAAEVGAEDGDTISGRGACWDLEKNTAIQVVTKRSIRGNKGRFGQDMIMTTGAAAASVAFRNAVFRIIPKTFVNAMYDKCEELAHGDANSLVARRTKAVQFFARFGITVDGICKRLGRAKLDDLTIEDVAILRAMAEEAKRGGTPVEELFSVKPAEEEGNGRGAEGLAGRMGIKPDEGNGGTPVGKIAQEQVGEQPESPEVAERRKQAQELKENAAKKPEQVKCDPKKKGCSKTGRVIAGVGFVCETHDPENPANKA